jgi:hypothetical protein
MEILHVAGPRCIFYSTSSIVSLLQRAIYPREVDPKRYNSVIVSSLSANEYHMAVLAPSSFSGVHSWSASMGDEYGSALEDILSEAQSWDNLTKSDCIKIYSDTLVSEYRNVAVISNSTNPTMLTETFTATGHDLVWSYWGTNIFGYYPETQRPDLMPIQILNRDGSEKVLIKYCLAQTSTPYCKLQMEPIMLIIVIICNTIKVGCILVTIFKSDFQPFITTGDALASFLENPDATTASYGPVSAIDVRKRRHTQIRSQNTESKEAATLKYVKRYRWFHAASVIRWSLAGSL